MRDSPLFERVIAWIGIASGLLLGVFPGILAIYSYGQWRIGYRECPLFAWFCALVPLSGALTALVATSLGIALFEGDYPNTELLSVALAGAIAGMLLLRSWSRWRRRG